MKNISFKLFELLNLESELAGVVNTETGEKVIEGLLSQKLPVVTKYWLNNLVNKVLAEEKKSIDELRNELIKKYGKEDEAGNWGIERLLPSGETDKDGNELFKYNPDFLNFTKEYEQLLATEKEISINLIKLDDLADIKTNDNYPLIFKYLIEEPVETVSAEEV